MLLYEYREPFLKHQAWVGGAFWWFLLQLQYISQRLLYISVHTYAVFWHSFCMFWPIFQSMLYCWLQQLPGSHQTQSMGGHYENQIGEVKTGLRRVIHQCEHSVLFIPLTMLCYHWVVKCAWPHKDEGWQPCKTPKKHQPAFLPSEFNSLAQHTDIPTML